MPITFAFKEETAAAVALLERARQEALSVLVGHPEDPVHREGARSIMEQALHAIHLQRLFLPGSYLDVGSPRVSVVGYTNRGVRCSMAEKDEQYQKSMYADVLIDFAFIGGGIPRVHISYDNAVRRMLGDLRDGK